MKRQENRWNNAYIDQLRQKQSVIKSKRKLTELIIDELEDSDPTENVVAAQQKSLKQPCLETNSIDEIDDDYEGLEWKRKSSKPTKVAVDELITQTNSDRSKPHRRLIDLVEFDDNEEIDESSPNLIKETGFMKQSKPQYDIDEILGDEDDSSHSRNRINIARKKINQSQSSVKSEKLVIEEAVLSEFEINRNSNKSASKKATTSKKSVDIDSFLSLSLEEEEKIDMKNDVKEEEAIESDVSQALLSTSFAPTRRNKNSHLTTREYNIENLLEDEEEEVEKGEDTDIIIAMKTSGTEWLKKLNEKLANASAAYLNGDNLNSTVITSDVKKTTSPPSLLTVNTSNMYLNENDVKKRKAKFIKNGFAEKLQKLLIRQASSINFVKHCMAKKSTNEQITQFKNVPNIIKAIPIYKQTSITGHNFSLIHAIQIYDDRDIKREDYVYLLISNDKCDMSKYFEKSSFAKANIQINIYPPWRKMLLKDCNQSIYFSADLIEVTELNSNIKPTISRSKQHSIHDLTCPQCLNSSDSCNLVLFDPNLFMRSMSTLVNHRTTNSSFTVFSNSQAHSNYMFHTQNDADYYNRVNQPTEARSQYIALNSILDALDHVGYYGFVTFRACVQRVSSPIDSSSNFSSSGLTQKTNTQITQRTTQFTQNYSHKRELIVSDKCGMFALIWLPLTTSGNSSNTENCDVKESQKYQFNSLKFIEKQALTERDHPVLYEQVNFLWHEMNKSREKRCKVQVKSFQRFIYVFEFVTQSRSSIESLGHSNSYLPLIGFSSLRKVISQTDNNMASYFFDLNDVVLLKMIHNSTMPIRIYLIDKISAYSSSQPSAEIKCIEFLSIDQIKDGRILEALEKNSILYKSDDCVLCLKNVFIRNSDIEMVHSNLYSSIVSISRSDLAEKSSYSISNEANLINRFLNDTFIDLSQRRRNDGYEFVKIEGSLLNLCEDSSLIVLVCLRCNKSHPKDCLSIPLNINIVRALYCESCGSTCDPTNNPAQIELKLSVYLNCIGVYQSVRVDLHPTTTSSLISMDRLKQAFKSKSCHEIQSNVFDYFKPLVNKSIGPLLCFLTFSDDTRIEAQELMLNEN